MIVFSGIMEHIMDGISLGVVFTSSFDIAFSTFIAIYAHEIPQQMGALGILIGSGCTPRTAIYWNIFGNVTSFIGVAIGLAIGTMSTDSNVIAICVVAGNFLYIGMTLMLPNIMH